MRLWLGDCTVEYEREGILDEVGQSLDLSALDLID
jgi:hypothetical protein